MICNCIIEHITPLPLKNSADYSKKFILDYSSCPIQFTCPAGSLEFDKQPVFLTDLPPMGEADVKFTRWSNVFQGDLVAYSVDGDFIPISLIHYEKQLLDERRTESQRPFRIALYRIRYKLPEDKKKVACVKNAVQTSSSGAKGGGGGGGGGGQLLLTGSKRRRGSNGGSFLALTTASSSASGASDSTQRKSQQGREYEYVDIATLYQALQQAFRQKSGNQGRVSFMRVLAVLVGLGGTDFSRYFFNTCFVFFACDTCIG
jgi:hypothetical protein